MKILATGEWLSRERVIRVASLCAVASVLVITVLFATSRGTLDLWGRPLGTDFSNVWAAGHMALEGSAAKTWSWPDHFAVQQWVHNKADVDFFGWHYPPPFLLVASLLALMPYVPALITWQIATLAPFAWLMWRLVPRRETILLTLAAPVTLICLMSGHNGFLTALLLGGGLALLDKRPLLAGMLFGCLLYKPQFALIIPPLLLATRNWRAIVGAIASSGALIGLTLQLWGWPVWQAFIDSLPLTRAVVIEQGSTGFHKIMSAFAAVRMWGGPIALAYAVQAPATACCVAAVAWVGWFGKSANVRNALVCAAVLISTPYVLDYDYVVLLPAIAFLWLDSQEKGWLDWDKSLLAFAWIVPLAARQIAEFTYLPVGLASAVAILAIALRRAVRSGERVGSAPAFA
ncbi:MAG TPA: glycosyltransferase family 87 protein [Sphingomicrobium sp.]|nr:glycosyltransferase family 87 protein [Sphingomicrobium sp.]